MSDKLQDETKYLSSDDQWLSKEWFSNTLEILFWFWVIGGIVHVIVFDQNFFPNWAIGLLIIIPLRWILIKIGIIKTSGY